MAQPRKSVRDLAYLYEEPLLTNTQVKYSNSVLLEQGLEKWSLFANRLFKAEPVDAEIPVNALEPARLLEGMITGLRTDEAKTWV